MKNFIYVILSLLSFVGRAYSFNESETLSIDQNGLRLYYDISNKDSYNKETTSSTNNVVYDLSGAENHGFINGVDDIYYDANEEALFFDGKAVIADKGLYIKNINYVSGESDQINDLEIEAHIKVKNEETDHGGGDQRIIFSFDRSEVFRFSVGSDFGGYTTNQSAAKGKLVLGFNNTDGTHDIYDKGYTGDLRDENWHTVKVSFTANEAGGLKFYVDGELTYTDPSTYAPIGNQETTSTPRFGVVGNGSEATEEGGAAGPGDMFYGWIKSIKYYTNKEEAATSTETQAEKPAGEGDGNAPYEIASLANLRWLSENMEAWEFNYIQTADIDAYETQDWNNGKGFSPVGDEANPFVGNYNGQGYVISNLTIDRPEQDYVGLFGYVGKYFDAKIQNVFLENIAINGNQYVGGLAGKVQGNSSAGALVSAIEVYGQVAGNQYTGGLIGLLYYKSTLTQSLFSGSVQGNEGDSSSHGSTGGLVGKTEYYSTISYSYAQAGVSGNFYVGGIVGRNTYSDVMYTYNRGDVFSYKGYAGGIAGSHQADSDLEYGLYHNFSTGKVTGASSSKLGGILGSLSTCSSCITVAKENYWDKTTAEIASDALDTTYAIPLTTEQLKSLTTANTTYGTTEWDFDDIWLISGNVNDGYPFLRTYNDLELIDLSFDAENTTIKIVVKGEISTDDGEAPTKDDFEITLTDDDGSASLDLEEAKPDSVVITNTDGNDTLEMVITVSGTLTGDELLKIAPSTDGNFNDNSGDDFSSNDYLTLKIDVPSVLTAELISSLEGSYLSKSESISFNAAFSEAMNTPTVEIVSAYDNTKKYITATQMTNADSDADTIWTYVWNNEEDIDDEVVVSVYGTSAVNEEKSITASLSLSVDTVPSKISSITLSETNTQVTISFTEPIYNYFQWAVNEPNDSNGENYGVLTVQGEFNDGRFESGYTTKAIIEFNTVVDSVENFTFLGDYQGHRYFISDNKDSWANFNALLKSSNGYLVVISTKDEAEFLKPFMAQENDSAWIGLYQDTLDENYNEPDGGWKWVNNVPRTYFDGSIFDLSVEGGNATLGGNGITVQEYGSDKIVLDIEWEGEANGEEKLTVNFNEKAIFGVDENAIAAQQQNNTVYLNNQDDGKTYVPDDVFEQALIDLGYDDVLDDHVITENIETIESLRADNSTLPEGQKIQDLTGIEDFSSIREVFFDNNEVSSVDFSNNEALESISIHSNNLTSLNVASNTLLKSLVVSHNEITSLDLSQNPLLERLIASENDIASLDLTQNTALEHLDLLGNALTEIDLSQNAELVYVNLRNVSPEDSSMALTSIDVTNNPKLQVLEMYRNQLESIDVSQNPELKILDLNDMSSFKGEIDLTQNTKLEVFVISGGLKSLDLSQNPELTILAVAYNMLTELDLSNNAKIEDLNVSNNQLSQLNLSLTSSLTVLDASGNENLNCIEVSASQIENIPVNWKKDETTSYSLDCKLVNFGGLDGGAVNIELQYVCSGDIPPSLTVSSTTVTHSINYQWQISNDNTTFTDILGATSSVYTPTAGIVTDTFFRRVSLLTLEGTTYTATSTSAYFAISPVGIAVLYGIDNLGTSLGSSQGGTTTLTVCEGQPLELAASGGATFTFKVNGVVVQGPSGSATFTATALTNGDKISVEVLDGSTACSTESEPLTVVVSAAPEVTLTSSAPNNTFCVDSVDDLVFTATTNDTSPTYEFRINGLAIQNSEQATFTPTGYNLLSGDEVFVKVSSPNGCSFTTSLEMIGIGESAGYAMIAGQNYFVCAGELNPTIVVTDTFNSSTTTSTQGQSQGSLSYQWQVSNDNETFTDIVGATGESLAPTTAITTVTYFRRATNASLNGVVCSTTTNAVMVGVSPGGFALLYSTNNFNPSGAPTQGATATLVVCEGQPIELAASGGATFTFKVNGVVVQGPSATSTFTGTSLVNGDQVSVEVDGGFNGCPSESDPLTVVVSAAPEVTLTSSAPNNTFCVDSVDDLVFTATTNDTSPTYEFRINGLAIQNSEQATFTPTGYNLLSGDEVFVKVSSPNGCSFTTSLEMIGIGESAGYAMVEGQNYFVCAGELNPTIVVTDTFSSNISSTINSSTTTSTQGQSQGSLSYQWQVSNDNETFTDIVGATGESLAPTTAITTVTYFRRATNASLNGVVCSTTTNAVMVGVSPGGFALLYSTNNFNPSGAPTQGATATLVVCEGQPIELAASGGATFTFKVNGVVVQGPSATSTFTGTSLVNGDQVSVEVDGGFNGCPSESDPLTVVVSPTPGIGLFSSVANNTICPGDDVTFTAESDLSSATYSFFINGALYSASANTSFTAMGSMFIGNDIVSVEVSSDAGCSATASISMSVNGAGNLGSAGYAMVAGQNYFVCAGELNPTIVVTDTFNSSTTTSTQGQSQGSLSYQWQVSNDNETFTDIVGATGESLAPTTAITTVTYFRRATNASLNGVVCSTTTNAVMVGVSPDGFALLYSLNNFNPSGGPTQGATATLVVCEGQPIELAASGGATFTFKVNGVVVQGPSAASTFTGTSLANGDQVSVEVEGGFSGCPSESNPLTIVRTSPADVGLFSSATNNTFCEGDIVSFTADSSNPDSFYTFYVNGLVISGPSQTSSITDNQGLLSNRDVILVEVTTEGGCSSTASLSMRLNGVINGSFSTSSITLCQGEILPEPIEYQGARADGSIRYQWQTSSNNVSFTDIVGETSASYSSDSEVVSDTYLRVITTSTLNGVSCEAISDPIAIVVDRSIYCNFEDADFDGVANEDDLCPDTPLDTPVDENGCSAEQLDSDLDGVLNEVDLCPDTPLGVPVNEEGCSEAEVQEKIENGDDDGDGVINILDRCPETPEGAEVDESGCTPEESEAIAQGDEDKDGVINENDVCPDTELGVRVNELGCPLSDYDSDFDGVSDDIDVCPDTEIGAEVDEKGCAAAQIEVDLDLDGVPNEEDLCPDTPLGEEVDEKGCSLAQIEADTDLDGVPNALDICPGTPLEEQADENGCSESQRDDDGDGVPNFIDRCPNTAQGAEIDENGCSALQLDGDDDGDGVLNSVDVCPNTPEGALIDANGCAYKAPKIFKQSFERIENARDDETGEISILLGRILTEDTNAVSTTIGEITLSIEAGEDADLFRLDGNELYLVGRLDYEEQKKHEVIIRATNDKGLSATQKMILKVQDIPNTVTKSNFTVAVFDVKTESSGSKVSYNRYFNPNVERGVGKWKIKKKIVGGADAGAFTIRTRGLDAGDTKSGKSTNTLPQQEDYLDFINPPDFENPQDHNRDNVYEVQVANINTNDGDTQQPISVIQTAIVVPEGDPTAIQLQSVPAAPTDDSDGDGVPDITDNSPFVANPDQSDEDGDGVGDVTDDADHDGVWNPNDTCPDTPYDTLVDVTGCPIFYLPPNNFSVNKAEKCADNNAIFLNIVDTSYTYNVNVTGAENLSETVSSNQWSLNNLSAGTYSICITVDGFTAEDFERCYNVTIAPPAALNVLSQKKQQSEVVTYKLSGGSVYNIYHNGKTIQTDKESYDLKLDPGVNNVKITTGIECQGIFEQNYFHSQRVLYSPLPFNETLNLFVGGDDREVKVEIYNSGSYLVHEQYVQPDPISRTASIETTQLSSGSYIIKVIGETTLTSQLIIKE